MKFSFLNTEIARFILSLSLTGAIIVINVGTDIGVLYGYIRDHPLSVLGLVAISLIIIGGLQYLFNKYLDQK